jgi:hypothetical protein
MRMTVQDVGNDVEITWIVGGSWHGYLLNTQT